MLRLYCNKSDKVYMTSPVVGAKPKKRDRDIEKVIKRFNQSLRELSYKQGVIRSRIEIDNNNAQWEVKLYDNAIRIHKDI